MLNDLLLRLFSEESVTIKKHFDDVRSYYGKNLLELLLCQGIQFFTVFNEISIYKKLFKFSILD